MYNYFDSQSAKFKNELLFRQLTSALLEVLCFGELLCIHTLSSKMTSCKFLITSTLSFNSWSSSVSNRRSRSTVHLKQTQQLCISK